MPFSYLPLHVQEAVLLVVLNPNTCGVSGRSLGVGLTGIGRLRRLAVALLVQGLDPELVDDPGRQGYPADLGIAVRRLIQGGPLVPVKGGAVFYSVVDYGHVVVEPRAP